MQAKIVRRVCWLVALAAIPYVVQAQESWKLTLGASYRDFDDVSFKATPLMNFGNRVPADGPLGLQGYTDADFAGITVSIPSFPVDYTTYNGGNEDLDGSDSWSPVIGLERTFQTEGRWTFSWVGNAQYYQMDVTGSDSGNAADAGAFDAFHNFYSVPLVPGTTPAIPPVPNNLTPVPGFSGGTMVTVENDMDMDLVVLDVGLKTGYEATHSITAFFELGPTLSYSDLQTSRSVTATWTPIPPATGATDPGLAVQNSDDDESKLMLGGFISLGGDLKLTERLSASAKARYDVVFADDPTTDHASVDLDGLSGQLLIIYAF